VLMRVLSDSTSPLVFSSGSQRSCWKAGSQAPSSQSQLSYQPLKRSSGAVSFPIIGRSGVGLGWVKGVRCIGLQHRRDPIHHPFTPRNLKKSKRCLEQKIWRGFFMRKEPFKANWGSLPNRLSKWNLLIYCLVLYALIREYP
jgi:hypothetical protein